MIDREKVIKGLEIHADRSDKTDCDDCPYIRYKGDCIGQLCSDALVLLKEQPEIVRCKDCKNWIAGYITDQDDFIPSKCGKYQQMVGHSSDDFCSLAERR